jgi:hypothetical protein
MRPRPAVTTCSAGNPECPHFVGCIVFFLMILTASFASRAMNTFPFFKFRKNLLAWASTRKRITFLSFFSASATSAAVPGPPLPHATTTLLDKPIRLSRALFMSVIIATSTSGDILDQAIGRRPITRPPFSYHPRLPLSLPPHLCRYCAPYEMFASFRDRIGRGIRLFPSEQNGTTVWWHLSSRPRPGQVNAGGPVCRSEGARPVQGGPKEHGRRRRMSRSRPI